MWPLSVRTFARMRHDPVLASVLAAYSLPILKTSWHLDPRGAPSKVSKLCADSLGLPILGRDKPGPARRRGVQWLDHVRTALGCLTYGHAIFEPVYDTSTGAAIEPVRSRSHPKRSAGKKVPSRQGCSTTRRTTFGARMSHKVKQEIVIRGN